MKPNNEDHGDREVRFPSLERKNSYIYMNKSTQKDFRILNTFSIQNFRSHSCLLRESYPMKSTSINKSKTNISFNKDI